jgi:hypothetical protein
MADFLVICLALLAGAAALGYLIYYLIRQNHERHLAECKDFKLSLVQAINGSGRKPFNIHEFVQKCGVSEKMANAVACELYATLWDKTLADGVITNEEKTKLSRLATLLDLPQAYQQKVALQRKSAKYREKVDKVLSDGRVTDLDRSELKQLRQTLGLTNDQSVQISGRVIRDSYLGLFRRIIDDSVITPEELSELRKFREAFGISSVDANRIVNDDVFKLYKEWFYGIMNSGQIEDKQECALEWLIREFGLNDEQVRVYRKQIAEVKEITRIREGDLPTVNTGKILESGEICHLEQVAQFRWETRTKINDVEGELLITSNRILFFSPTKSFAFSPSRIHDIECRRNHIYLKTTASKGTGSYFTSTPKRVAAILEGVVKKHNYLLVQRFSTTFSRHIPPNVRQDVWQRDNGKCVQCGAQEYLEFDHIIPHSRGGANSVGNVQLLCRSCNNEKRDRI